MRPPAWGSTSTWPAASPSAAGPAPCSWRSPATCRCSRSTRRSPRPPCGRSSALPRHADVVLVAGTRMDFRISYAAPPYFRDDARFIQVDIDGAEIGRNRYVESPVVGDCGPALEALAVELARREYQPRDPAWAAAALSDRLAQI